MCGIFGYILHRIPCTTRDVLNVLLDSLQRMEYRGYDSAGLCVDDVKSKKHIVVRSVGNISKLRERVFSGCADLDFNAQLENHEGIAHTRWATHGPPSEANCHPQASNNMEFVVVHNGIITNFMTIKQMLLEEGYHFSSDTDTEVIVVLAEHIFSKDHSISFADLAGKVMAELDGAYALLIKSVHFPGELIACKEASPLVIGLQNGKSNGTASGIANGSVMNKLFFSSDVASFLPYTQEVIFLEDGDVAHYSKGALTLYNDATPVSRTSQTVDVSPEGLCKGAYPSFMLKEIYEQPESVSRSMRDRIDFNTREVTIKEMSDGVRTTLLSARRLMLVACGTSFHSCVAARPIFEELLPNISITLENAPDLLDREPRIGSDDVCVFVSQSGETADTLMALQYCKKYEAMIVGLTNVPGSSVLRLSDFALLLNAGVEVGVASTKAYTSQVVVLTLLALFLSKENCSGNSSHSHGGSQSPIQKRRLEIIDGLAALPGALSHCLKCTNDVATKLAEELCDAKAILILGRGYDYATALEAALKVKELTYIHTEGIHCGELKHGPLALVDEHSTIVAFCPHDKFLGRSKSAIQQVKARGGRVVAITTEPDAELVSATSRCVEVPAIVDCLQGIVNVVPLQLLAHHLAVRRGLNVDCPRNLAKSVTVQ
ncbi:glucosamine-fructose-6-phosphate aminotransferase, putative [Trypanosoma brucei gambiense DAL972]|uniref:glutamine--fructose-6-phosphate transaminase (isomerizing) n=1 Tax=Trypanosoma brucei gambiense (strain MHOM/CI/86/DAL972) TaxID=679716 RepID=C9ZTL6_TRYB9|nr:glucosamine-fructose-6-phosphate aminotransferase, putative [Trypanosoma brucei gambiense DAL972]CBH12751.1 glucosamine-fructose-6-phosphate aminotransferase, putative [Trypanosoma brucei gambiense DAL972]|eukprot:XP_011775031.1 glucosamine-fructose-6-phosphate aminotransferase, putative [Trypanosoma brucei gambiense DAL972]